MNHASTAPRANRGILGTLFGGLRMSWPAVFLLAAGSAVLTAVFLILPVFQDTSFQMMGVQLEAWILLAVLILSNCKKPLESACKTFVFFLVSQPLIYLLQVPFSWQGWGLFRYYCYWFILTLLTFPGALIGWYITKRNWLSALILAPVLAYLAMTARTGVLAAAERFPHLVVMALFCAAQIAAYVWAFLPTAAQKAAGLAVAVITVAALSLFAPKQAISAYDTLPGGVSFSEEAEIRTDDRSVAEAQWVSAPDARVHVILHKPGSTVLTVQDQGREVRYELSVVDDGGTYALLLTKLE